MGGRRASTSTWCPLGTLRETIWLSLSAGWSSTTRSSPFSRRADAENRLSESPNLTKHQTSQNQYQRGSRAPSHVRPYDGEWTLSLHLSRPTIVYGAGSRRLRDADAKRKAGSDQHNTVTTVTSREPTPKKTTILCSDAATRQNQHPASRNTKHYRASTGEEVVLVSYYKEAHQKVEEGIIGVLENWKEPLVDSADPGKQKQDGSE